MPPGTAMVALAGATGEPLGWLDFWLPMLDLNSHYGTINETYILRRDGVPLFSKWMLCEQLVAVWKTQVNVYR